MTRDGKMCITVSPADYRAISRAMMILKRGLLHDGERTDGELLAEICRAWMRSQHIRVEGDGASDGGNAGTVNPARKLFCD